MFWRKIYGTIDNFKIDEKECTLIYSFAKPVLDLKEEPSDPTLVLAR